MSSPGQQPTRWQSATARSAAVLVLPLLCKSLLHLAKVNAAHGPHKLKNLCDFNRAGGEAEDEIMAGNDWGNTQKQWSCSAH